MQKKALCAILRVSVNTRKKPIFINLKTLTAYLQFVLETLPQRKNKQYYYTVCNNTVINAQILILHFNSVSNFKRLKSNYLSVRYF